MLKKIHKCRICGNSKLIPVVDLGEQFLTGIFPKSKDHSNLTKGPLRLVKCHGDDSCCGLLQLENSYDSSEMYGESYGYRSGLNSSMVKHLQDKVSKIQNIVDLKAGDLIIDIGSNDGTTLSTYPRDLLLIGVDPTGGKFADFYPPHIKLIADFFSAESITNFIPNKKAKVVTAFSMFYDLEDPVNFAKEVASILDTKKGIWIFEQSYMPTMLERNSYDTVCHEHLEYYGLSQIMWIAESAGLKIIDVELNDINGGSFSVIAALKGSDHICKNDNVEILLTKERQANLNSLQPYEAFAQRINRGKAILLEFIFQETKQGHKIAGIGASTKGNVLLQYCNLSEDHIAAIGDVNPDKFGAYTPGSNIPIQDEKVVLDGKYDYLIVLPWHFKSFFLNNPLYKGKRLIFPLPELEIVDVE